MYEFMAKKEKKSEKGENLFTCSGKVATGEMATTDWYNEIKLHNFKKEFQQASGHFTQLIWKNTEEVGFGIATNGSQYFVVANYYPAGNVLGEFANNVVKA